MVLLSKDFLKLILVSIILALPISYYAIDRWLADFAYRTDIEWWVFVVAGTATILIALLTISFQAMKAALINPVESIRSE